MGLKGNSVSFVAGAVGKPCSREGQIPGEEETCLDRKARVLVQNHYGAGAANPFRRGGLPCEVDTCQEGVGASTDCHCLEAEPLIGCDPGKSACQSSGSA